MPNVRPDLDLVGFWRRTFAVAIDICFCLPFVLALMTPVRLFSLNHRTVLPVALWYLVQAVIVITFVTRFGGTPGKLIMGLRVVDGAGRYLTGAAAVLRLGPTLLSGAMTLLGQQYSYSSLPADLHASTLKELNRIVVAHRSPLEQILSALITVLLLVDTLLINRDDLQQTGHDRLARSFVVTRASLLAARTDSGTHG